MEKLKLILLVGAAALGLAIAGCDGDEGDEQMATDRTTEAETTEAETTEGPQVEQPVTVNGIEANFEGASTVSGSTEFVLGSFFFEPTVLVGQPGETVTLEATNESDTAHTFTLRDQDVDVVLDPGSSQEIEVMLPDSGELGFICRFHESQGMVGQLRAQ